jgi:hypothetical protein
VSAASGAHYASLKRYTHLEIPRVYGKNAESLWNGWQLRNFAAGVCCGVSSIMDTQLLLHTRSNVMQCALNTKRSQPC